MRPLDQTNSIDSDKDNCLSTKHLCSPYSSAEASALLQRVHAHKVDTSPVMVGGSAIVI